MPIVDRRRAISQSLGRGLTVALPISIAIIGWAGSLEARAKPHLQDGRCPTYGRTIPISEDSIGYLGTAMSLKRLRDLCPSARDTSISDWDYEAVLGVVFELDNVKAIAVRNASEQFLETDRPDYWIVDGNQVVLHNGLRLDTTTWEDLHRKLGNGAGSTGLGAVMVTFCAEPKLTFELDADPWGVGDLEYARDLSAIPAGSGVRRVLVGPGLNLRDRCEPR